MRNLQRSPESASVARRRVAANELDLPQCGDHLVPLKIIRERLLRSAPNEDEIAAVMRDSEVVIITTRERGSIIISA